MTQEKGMLEQEKVSDCTDAGGRMKPEEHTDFDKFYEGLIREASEEDLEEAKIWVRSVLYPQPCPLCEVGQLSSVLDEEGKYPLLYSVCSECESEICTGEQLDWNVKFRRNLRGLYENE